jgi:hypothetical protein
MSIAWIGAAGIVGLGVAGPAGAITKAQLHSKVLNLSNLPTGWTVDNSHSGGGGSVSGGCLTGIKRSPKKKGDVKATVQYEDGQLPELDETLAAGPGIPADYGEINDIFRSCKHLTISESGETIPVTIGAMSFPRLGNATSAYGATISVDGVSAGFDFVIFRVGSILGLMYYADIGQPDPTQLQGFVTEAVNKIEGKPVGPAVST